MFCDTCHWYTAGEPICPHCGAKQSPKKTNNIFNLPGDVSVLDGSFMDAPLVDSPMPEIAPSAPETAQPSISQSPTAKFCGRCGIKTGAGRFCSRCGSPLI